MSRLPFNRPLRTGGENARIAAALERGWTGGNGPAGEHCQALIRELTGAAQALLTTHSCTAALEMAALLAEIGPGDEVIMPSFTFVSTANAFVLRGATPVFVDIDADTLNLDERALPRRDHRRARSAIVAVHYAGVGCDMDGARALAAAHGLMRDRGRGAGRRRHATAAARSARSATSARSASTRRRTSSAARAARCSSTTSAASQRAEILREKGTNRSASSRGEVDKYTWVDIGSSFLPCPTSPPRSCWPQLEARRRRSPRARLAIWDALPRGASSRLERAGRAAPPGRPARLPGTTRTCTGSARRPGEPATRSSRRSPPTRSPPYFHYVPLHSSPAGRRFGRAHGPMDVTDAAAERLLRLPLWVGMTPADVARVAERVAAAL